MIQERNEVRDGALKINVVLPQRVVSINQQGLRTVYSLFPRASSNMIARMRPAWRDRNFADSRLTASIASAKITVNDESGCSCLPRCLFF